MYMYIIIIIIIIAKKIQLNKCFIISYFRVNETKMKNDKLLRRKL